MSTAPKTVLVVDDDPDFLLQQRLGLEAAGYRVVSADNSVEALEVFAAEQPDAAVLDLMMEDVDAGFTLCYRIKKLRPEVPVIMVTGVASETGIEFDAATKEERAWVKADVLLAKPIRFEQLKKELERLLN